MAAAETHRLLVVTDWDMGFQLTSRPRALPDVAPGDAYVTEIFPQRRVSIHDVVVEGFALVKISSGSQAPSATVEPLGPRRLYQLHAPIEVDVGESVRLHLCNDSGTPLKQKDGTIVRREPREREP